MIVENLFKSIERGRKGLNNGLSSGLSKLDSTVYGVQRRWLTVWAGDSGSGKSSLVLFTQIYQPFKQKINNSNIDLHFLLFSFEMSAEVLLAKLLSIYIYETYNEVVSYGDILSLSKPLDDHTMDFINDSKWWLEEFEKCCEIIDKPVTAKGLYAICKEWSKKFGQYKEVEKTEEYVKEDYIPNNPEQYLIVVVDHIKLLSVSAGHQSKQEIDEACDYLIHFRNKCNFTINIVQQFNRNFKSMERRDSNNYLPDLNDLSDSSGPAQAAEVVIAIYHPYREKKARCDEYDIRQLKDRARSILTLKNRFGMADKRFMTAFYGEVGLWKELPLPNQISDYSIYTDLK